MKALTPADASGLSLLAESPKESTRRLVYEDLSPEARKIADAMVPTKPAKKTFRQKIKGKIKRAAVQTREHVAEDVDEAVKSTADTLLRWSK